MLVDLSLFRLNLLQERTLNQQFLLWRQPLREDNVEFNAQIAIAARFSGHALALDDFRVVWMDLKFYRFFMC